MKQYQDLLYQIIDTGERRSNRTGVDTLGIFGAQMRFDLSKGFPLVTTKKVFWKGIVHELLWLISGSTNVKPLQENDIHIWDEWADKNGDLGPIYGKQWRDWDHTHFVSDDVYEASGGTHGGSYRTDHIDQLKDVIDRIKTTPDCRRMIVTAWNPTGVPRMAIPPCHAFFQFRVSGDKRLSCHLYQRSADMFLGVPFNIASYALLTHLVAYVTNLKVGDFIHSFGDAHIYVNHLAQVEEQLKRQPLPLPTLALKCDDPPDQRDLFKITYEDIALLNYECHPPIKGDVAV